MLKVAAGGFHHETNTFSSRKTPYQDFVEADGWPALSAGEEMFAAIKGVNIPIAGFCDETVFLEAQVKPLLWCSAQPGGVVEPGAFEKITSQLIEMLERQKPFDAIFLDLHGAMVVENFDDGEAEILRRVRKSAGDIPVFLALDLHANISQEMFEFSDFMLPYRNYPHTDMAETGRQVCKALMHCVKNGIKLHKAMHRPGFLIPITSQCILAEPAKNILSETLKIEREYKNKTGFFSLGVAYGFPLADVLFSGPSIIAYSDSAVFAEEAVDKMQKIFDAARKEFSIHLLKPEDAIKKAAQEYNGKPIILSDTQDNPGAGGASDGVDVLRKLVEAQAEKAVVATVCDPEVALIAHKHKTFTAFLGGKSGATGMPLEAEFKVIATGDGVFEGHGLMYGGGRMNLGPCALIETGKVHVIVSSIRQQAADRGIFHHLGVKPEDYKIISLKSSVHFRADFDEIAGGVIFVDAPGINIADPAKLKYKKCKRSLA